MSRKANFGWTIGLVLGLAAIAVRPVSAAPLTVGYSDWPGWVAWQVAIDKGWIKEAGLDLTFQWFDYSASMDAFAAGKLDANLMTNGDTLVTGAGGGKGIMVMLTDYSSGNDMIVAKPGIKSLKDLKGKKIGIEVGLVEHLLLLHGLNSVGMKEKDVKLVNAKTNETPQVLASGQVSAIGAWQPISGQAMKASPGSHPDLHIGASARPDLRRAGGQPGQLERPPRRLDEADRRLGQGGPLHQRSRRPRMMPSRSWPRVSN